ncbi:MAG: protein translocase subunit SecD [Gemmatimonadota bacterium]|nr:protein translocase subunit SecD [Gemmatimonadota bacterium]
MNLKYRILIIAGLILASVWALFPREVKERVKRPSGFVYDTVRRVPLKRGLDLEGGMHLALEIDESKGAVPQKAEALDRALKVVRTRIDQFGVAEPVVQKSGTDRIIVELPGIDDPQRAQEVVQKSAFLQFQITDETQALEKALPRIDGVLKQRLPSAATPSTSGTQVATTDGDTAAGAGLQSLFTKDTAKTSPDSAKRDSAKTDSAKSDTATAVPAVPTAGQFSKLIQQGGIPGEYYVAETDIPLIETYLASPDVQGVLPPGKVIRFGSDTMSLANNTYRALYVLDARPIITGEFLTDAKPNTDPTEGTIVEFQFNNEGGRKFRNETSKHIKDFMAIVLDDRVMGRPPVIQSAIGSRGQITMGSGRDLQAASDLALVLRAGSLPAPLKIVEVRQIGASLGKDSIESGIRAGLVAVGMLVLIILVYYKFSGVLAITGLILYVLFTLGMLAGFDAVLTLPGIAGFVLSLGVAVDANVLIFERIREELDRGKTVRLAIDEGFGHAMSAIVDSNVTAALTAVVLYQFGTGPVRGFAVTLLAGIIASMISSIFVVRTFYMVWLNRSQSVQTLSI